MLVKEIDFFEDIFKAYPHQRAWMQAFFSGQYKYYMELVHRRGGKDATFFNTAWLIAAMLPGNYVYTLPKIGQARNVIWEGTDLNGERWLDKIPKHLLAREPNNTSCKLYFTSGGMLHVTGADNILNMHLGSNLRGLFMSEFHKTHPRIWDYLRPILKRSKGFAAFNYTAFGQGHAYRLFEQNKDNAAWHCRKLTVDQTRDNEGNFIFSPEEVEEERASGMDEEIIQQEYYCDETVAIKGTFFAEHLAKARNEGRIVKGLEVYPKLPVHTSWDIGSRDTNAIWWFQVVGHGDAAQFRYFHQEDHNYQSTEFYVELLLKIQKHYKFGGYGHHFLPHDVTNVEYTSNKTRRLTMQQKGIHVTPVPKVRVIERVEVARIAFKQCWFDEVGCKHGLAALEVSRSGWNEDRRAFISDEVHDWASHASAAFQYGHVGWLDVYNKPRLVQQKEYARYRQPKKEKDYTTNNMPRHTIQK
jgi:hypothetical protein